MTPDREKIIEAVEEAFDIWIDEYEGTSYYNIDEVKNLKADALELLKEQEAVEPIKTCASANPLGVDGLLIVGNCPVCGQYSINNRDNKFCGGCGIPINWTNITERMRGLFPYRQLGNKMHFLP